MNKTLLAAFLALFASFVGAADNTTLVVNNAAGGYIRLSYEPCDNGWLMAQASDGEQEISGCWTLRDERVVVEWETGEAMAYPLDMFVNAPVQVSEAQ